MTQDVIRALEEARRLCAVGWTQRVGARDKNSNTVSTKSPDAVYFCLWGSIYRAENSHTGQRAYGAIVESIGGINPDPVEWNDAPDRTQADVLALFDRTIAKLRGISPATQ